MTIERSSVGDLPTSTADYAARYLDIGIPLPIESTGKRKRSHGAALQTTRGTTQWSTLLTSPPSEDEVRTWYEVDPQAGVGLITGNGLVVDDYDIGAPDDLPETPITRTHRGVHVWYEGSATTIRTTWGERRGRGAYVVVPPSQHQNGGNYGWETAPPGLGNGLIREESFRSLPPLDTCLPLLTYVSGGARGSSPVQESSRGFAERALGVIGLENRGIGTVHCPFHPDGTPSAGLVYSEIHRRWVLTCRACGHSHLLSTAYAKTRNADLSAPTISKWWTRLLIETGVVDRVAQLDLDLPNRQQTVLAGFLLLTQVEAVQRGVHPSALTGVPFAKSFGVPWCGISETTFEKARGELARAGWIRPSGELVFRGRKARLWLPGLHVMEAAFPLRIRGVVTSGWGTSDGASESRSTTTSGSPKGAG